MRALIIGMILFLSACNGSDKTVQVPYSDPAFVAKVDSLTKALAAATHEDAAQAEKLSSIQLFATVNEPVSADHVVEAIDFGPCSGPGVKTGATEKNGLDEQTQVFKQTPSTTCPGAYAEYDV